MTQGDEKGSSPRPSCDQNIDSEVVVFGTYDSELHPRVAVLCEGLAATGRVTQINHRLGLSTADKIVAASSVSGTFRMLIAMARAWVVLWRQARKYQLSPDLVVVGYLGHFDVHLARVLWPNSRIALDYLVGLADTASDRGLAGGAKYRLLNLVDSAALRRADIVVVDTEEQLQQLGVDVQERCIVIPVGATRVWSEQSAPPAALPLRVCFVGLYTPLHGAPIIGRAIALLAEDDRIEFTMVGSGQERAETELEAGGSTRVTWVDWLPSEELPALVASQHVCLGIFGTTPKALRVVPTKVYQGLAAGNRVLTSATAPQQRVLGATARYVAPGDAQALASELRNIANEFVALGSIAALGPVQGDDRFSASSVVAPLLAARAAMTDTHSLIGGPALSPSAWLRFDLFHRRLNSLSPSRILEIGSGLGAVGARLVAAGHAYTAAEFSAESRAAMADLLAAEAGGTSRIVASVDELDPAERFDVVCAFEVLEHIDDDLAALTDWVRRLEPGGLALLSVPAWPDRFSAADIEVGHFRRYEPAQLHALARAAGLERIEVRGYGYPLGDLLDRTRDIMATRAQRRRPPSQEQSIEDRTKNSGAWFQPPASMNSIIWIATLPFRKIQRRFPRRGAGLILIAAAPDAD